MSQFSIQDEKPFVDAFDDLSGRPKPSRAHFVPLILLGGLISTFVVLLILFVVAIFLQKNLLSFIVGPFPIAALLAGAIAGGGYAVSARMLQFFPSKRFIVFICILQFCAFFAGRYIEYLPIAILADNPPGFVEYYRDTVEETEWQSSRAGSKPYKMGMFGYAVEFYMGACFSLTSLIGLGILSGASYCRPCQRFMKTQLEFEFPARAAKRTIPKKDTAALENFQQEDAQAFASAMEIVKKITKHLEVEENRSRNDLAAFLAGLRNEILQTHGPIKGVSNTIAITFAQCRDCENYRLLVNLQLKNNEDKTAFKAANLLEFIDGEFKFKMIFEPDQPAEIA